MKVRIKMEDFIVDEEDKDLAKVAFHRAEKIVHRRKTLPLILPLAILYLVFLFLNLTYFPELTYPTVAVGGALFIVMIVWFLKRESLTRKEYEAQLSELKLQMRKK